MVFVYIKPSLGFISTSNGYFNTCLILIPLINEISLFQDYNEYFRDLPVSFKTKLTSQITKFWILR